MNVRNWIGYFFNKKKSKQITSNVDSKEPLTLKNLFESSFKEASKEFSQEMGYKKK